MSWHYLQEQEAVSWAGSCSAGAPFALSRLMPTAEACCSLGNGTDCSSASPSGMTSAPSTASPGEGTSMSSAVGSPARTSRALAPALESRASDPGSGLSSLASLAKYDPVTRSWRTPQTSLLGASESFSGTWPRAGIMRDGTCWALTTWAPHTSATAFGSWHTPRAHLEGWGVGRHMTKAQQRRTRADVHTTVRAEVDRYGHNPRPSRIEWLMMWPI